MQIKFTKHALERVKERKVTTKQVLLTIKKPDFKTLEEEDLLSVYKKFNHLALKVVLKQEEDEIRVVTVHWVEKERLTKLKPLIEGEKI